MTTRSQHLASPRRRFANVRFRPIADIGKRKDESAKDPQKLLQHYPDVVSLTLGLVIPPDWRPS